MVSYTVSHLAYIKVTLHAAKYPHKQVNGVLLGNTTGSAGQAQVEVTNAIPLLHHWTSLSPSMEIGLDLVSLSHIYTSCADTPNPNRKCAHVDRSVPEGRGGTYRRIVRVTGMPEGADIRSPSFDL